MSKRFLIIMAVLVVGFIGLTVASNKKDAPTQGDDSTATSEHVKGENTTGVELIEFADFQCPSCGSYFPVIQQVVEKYKDRISFRFRHFPLVQIHQNAMITHRAAEAAGNQGKFWEMYDLIFERQASWSKAENANRIMEDYASELGLNVDKFREDFASAGVNSIIQADLKLGQSMGVTGTPTFFINGEKIDKAPQNVDGFSKLLDETIAKNKN